MIKKTILHALLSWTGLALFLLVTKPTSMPLIFLIIPFCLLYAAIFLTTKVIIAYNTRSRPLRSPLVGHLPLVIASMAVLVIALQSVGQLSIRDVVALGLLILVGYFYVHRNAK